MAEPRNEIKDTPRYALYLDRWMLDGLSASMASAGSLSRGRAAPAPGEGPHERLWQLLGSPAFSDLPVIDSEQDLANVRPGQLVNVSGTSLGNPLLPIFDFVGAMMPLVTGEPTPPPPAKGAKARPSTPMVVGDQEEAQVQRVLNGMIAVARDDLRSAPVVDAVLTTDAGLPVIMTLDRSQLGPAGENLLVGRLVRVVAKVAAVVPAGETVNLLRRTALAATGAEASRGMLADLAEGGLELEMADPAVDGPALELLPLAVLV